MNTYISSSSNQRFYRIPETDKYLFKEKIASRLLRTVSSLSTTTSLCMIINDFVEIIQDAVISGKCLKAKLNFSAGDTVLSECPLMQIKGDSGDSVAIHMKNISDSFASLTSQNKLMVMQCFCPPREILIRRWDYSSVTSAAVQLVPVDLSQLVQLYYIVILNAALVEKGSTTTALYYFHSRMNHSCAPNAAFAGGGIRAIRDIRAGDSLVISYMNFNMLKASAPFRWSFLHKNYSFECQCPRCVDPIDLGRVTRCKSCLQAAVVFGFTPQIPIDTGMAASCTNCQRGCTSTELISSLNSELELGQAVLDFEEDLLLVQFDAVQSREEITARWTNLHERTVRELSGCHWVASALLTIHFSHIAASVARNPVVLVHYGEAAAELLRVSRASTPFLAADLSACIGTFLMRCCESSSPQPLRAIAGRHWSRCFDQYKAFRGPRHPTVAAMEAYFAEDNRSQGQREGDLVCCSRRCPAPLDPRRVTVGGSKRSVLTCAQCSFAHYCDRACQKADWKEHREFCIVARDIPAMLASAQVVLQTRSSPPAGVNAAAVALNQAIFSQSKRCE